jgi:hypothetical protein
MVNANRVKRKLPGLLVDQETTKRKGWNSFMRCRYQLERFKKRTPQRFNTLTNQLIVVLEEMLTI